MSRKTLMLAVGALGVAAAVQSQVAAALPVIPGATGYGIDTPAGRGGTVYRVTNLNESGSGSLAACAQASGPRVCIFEVSGVIKLTREMGINSPYLTIAGQTAPSPGIMVRGAPLVVYTSDVLIQHLRFRTGDDPDGPDPDLRDSLSVSQPNSANKSRNIVFDHNSIEWGVDELTNLWGYFDKITLNNNLFAEPLNDSIHPQGPHGYGPIFTGWDPGDVSMQGNLFAHIDYRNPASRARNFIFVNNLTYNRGNGDVSLSSDGWDIQTTNYIVGNRWIKGPDYKWSIQPIFIDDQSDATPFPDGSMIYQKDNVSDEPYSGSSLIGRWDNKSFSSNILSSATLPAGVTPKPSSQVYDDVLANVGARPADRDSVDKRIIDSVKNRNGQIINCVAADGSSRCSRNAGGWPTYPVNRRALTLPANPNAVTASGYTNLEIWLQGMAAEVEGRKSGNKPNPPLNVKVQ